MEGAYVPVVMLSGRPVTVAAPYEDHNETALRVAALVGVHPECLLLSQNDPHTVFGSTLTCLVRVPRPPAVQLLDPYGNKYGYNLGEGPPDCSHPERSAGFCSSLAAALAAVSVVAQTTERWALSVETQGHKGAWLFAEVVPWAGVALVMVSFERVLEAEGVGEGAAAQLSLDDGKTAQLSLDDGRVRGLNPVLVAEGGIGCELLEDLVLERSSFMRAVEVWLDECSGKGPLGATVRKRLGWDTTEAETPPWGDNWGITVGRRAE
jgi:hypothetical protein